MEQPRRYGKTHLTFISLADELNKGNSVFVVGLKEPSEYIERLFSNFNIIVNAIPHYVTINDEMTFEETAPYRTFFRKGETKLTGYEFRKI